MQYAMVAPQKYIQGRGVLKEVGKYTALFGKKAMVVWGTRTKAAVQDVALPSLAEAGVEITEEMFAGECSHNNADKIAQAGQTCGAKVFVVFGGGKAIDCVKGAADKINLPLIVVSTLAATDAPTSGLSVWYEDNGDYVDFEMWKFNPNIVIVDTEVIAKAPVRQFVSGIGDALATWIEAKASYEGRAGTCAFGLPPQTILAVAKASYDILLEYGIEAKSAIEQQVVIPAVEKCVEANILMSGLGFESGGCASAHAIGNSLTFFPEAHDHYHGEKVAFGIVTQLCLDEDMPVAEIYRIVDFMIEVGLPVCFADLELQDVSRDRIMEFGKVAAGPGSLTGNHTFEVTPESLSYAMIAADALGKRRKALKGLQCN